MIDLLFDMFNVTKEQIPFKTLDNVQIGYNEDLHFITKSPLVNLLIIECSNKLQTLLYKIQHNTNLHSNSAIKIFKNFVR